MSEYITFDYQLVDNVLSIEAEITLGKAGYGPDLNGPGVPPEPPTAEIESCYIVNPEDPTERIKFIPDNIYIRSWTKSKHSDLIDSIEETALEKWMDQ